MVAATIAAIALQVFLVAEAASSGRMSSFTNDSATQQV
jgi:hypothetical protein